MPHDPRMGFFDHLEVLRKRLLVVGAVFVVAALVAFFFMDPLIQAAKRPATRLDIALHYLKPQEKFLSYVRASLIVGIAAAVPVGVSQIVAFAFPGLRGRERRLAVILGVTVVVFFFGGLAFGFAFLQPFAVRFFAEFAGRELVVPVWSIAEYLTLTFSLCMATALVFQAPWILVLLMAARVVQAAAFRRGRRYAVVLCYVVGGVVTPPDVLTQLAVGTLLYALYEATTFVGMMIQKRRR